MSMSARPSDDLTVTLSAALRSRYPDGVINDEAEEIADLIRSVPGILVVREDALSSALGSVLDSVRTLPLPRCPSCNHPVRSHNHGSFDGLAECLERVSGGMCWCKHYMSPESVGAEVPR